jgi:predicted nucleotidyltransferase
MLTKQQKDIIIQTMLPYHPKKVSVFGSVARNEATKNSDIDILYRFVQPLSLLTIAGIKLTLEDKLNKKIDLVLENTLHPLFKHEVENDIELIYEA